MRHSQAKITGIWHNLQVKEGVQHNVEIVYCNCKIPLRVGDRQLTRFERRIVETYSLHALFICSNHCFAKSPWFLQCPKLCGEAEVVERYVDRCWCKEGDEWGTGWLCHPEASLLDILASRISVELIVDGSRFPRLLCSVRVMLSHRWFCPCRMLHATWSESATAACRKRLPNI